VKHALKRELSLITVYVIVNIIVKDNVKLTIKSIILAYANIHSVILMINNMIAKNYQEFKIIQNVD
jgi:hypothetical protein